MKRMLFLLTLLVSIAVTGRPANAQVKQAGEALEKQSYEEALRYVDEALRANPDMPSAPLSRRWEPKCDSATRISERDPTAVGSLWDLAVAHSEALPLHKLRLYIKLRLYLYSEYVN